jgi:hypothetical protein
MGALMVAAPAATGAAGAATGAGVGVGAAAGVDSTLAIGVKAGAATGTAVPPPKSSTSTVYAVPSTVTLYFTLITAIPLSKNKFLEIFHFTNQ